MLDLDRIQAITLDLDDTLWPVWPAIHRAEQVLVDWLAQHAPQAAVLARDIDVHQAVRRRVNALHTERAHDLSFLRRETIRALLVQAGHAPELAESAFEVFFAERQRVDLFDDVLPALVFWSARYPVVALSNGNADVHRVGIGGHFHAAVSARETGMAKPDARIFEAAAHAAGVPPEAVLHVGDDALLDVVGALAIGMQVAWVNREGHPWLYSDSRPQLEVSDLHGLCRHWHDYPY